MDQLICASLSHAHYLLVWSGHAESTGTSHISSGLQPKQEDDKDMQRMRHSEKKNTEKEGKGENKKEKIKK